MKKISILLLFAIYGTVATAQATKKAYIIFQTNPYEVKKYVNGKEDWKPEVPYKDYVRIIFSPFDIPVKLSNPMNQELMNQVAEFIYKSHLKEFEKFKLHGGFRFEVRDYNLKDYERETSDCTSCRYQHQKTVIAGFNFIPKEGKGFNEYYKKLGAYLTRK